MKLINAYAKAADDQNLNREHEFSAHRLHADLFDSGLERVLLVCVQLPKSSFKLTKNVADCS
jgi:hypothetical protein